MGQGQDKIARSLLDIQPSAIVEFYKIYPDIINKPTFCINIHGGSIFEKAITWQGVEYIPVSVEGEGFELNATSQLPRPKLRIANKDYLVTSLLINNYDFKNAKVIRKKTFVKFLDDVNFDGGNPFGSADSSAEISQEEYVIGQKTQENKIFVEFELTSPLDLENFEVNSRRILGKYCYWMYRGQGCNYAGPPINKEDGKFFIDPTGGSVTPDISDFSNNNTEFQWSPTKTYDSSTISYVENPKVLINSVDGSYKEPLKVWYVCVSGNSGRHPESNPTYWQKDGCNKKLSSCRLRFREERQFTYITTETEYSEDAIKTSGYKLGTTPNGGYLSTGKLYTQDAGVTGAFGDDFSLALWFQPYSNSTPYAGYIQTNADSENSFAIANYTRNNLQGATAIIANYSDTLGARYYEGINIFDTQSNKTLLYIEKSGKNLKVKMKTDSNPAQTVYSKLLGSDRDYVFNTNEFALGINEWGFTSDVSSYADYFGCIIFDRPLKETEYEGLLIFDNSGTLRLRPYSQASSSYSGDVVAWWEETGVVGAGIGFLDSHTGSRHLTGIGDLQTSGSEFFAANIVVNEGIEEIAVLPFGGFPGTDGFQYGV